MVIVLIFILIVLAVCFLAGMIHPPLVFMPKRLTVVLLLLPLLLIVGVALAVMSTWDGSLPELTRKETPRHGLSEEQQEAYCEYIRLRKYVRSLQAQYKGRSVVVSSLDPGDEVTLESKIRIVLADEVSAANAENSELSMGGSGSNRYAVLPAETVISIDSRGVDRSGRQVYKVTVFAYEISGHIDRGGLLDVIKLPDEDPEITQAKDEVRELLTSDFPGYDEKQLNQAARKLGWPNACQRQ